ncbi:MAG TPA: hypothetical protein VHE36_15185 [Sphingomicrobium sp.]|nr:hypothetical protein [Sphingomicrobium sp.]
MGVRRLSFLGPALLLGTPAAAQLTAVPHSGEQSIVVTGERLRDVKPPDMSDWKVAETPHVLLFSKADPDDLARIAGNLEKLHFLLSILLNRVDTPDETLKLSVTMIGDPADFDQLGLHNVRWQQGPYPSEFPDEIYYDPREDGAVLASPDADQCFKLDRGAAITTGEELTGFSPFGGNVENSLLNAASGNHPGSKNCGNNPNKVSVTAEGRLYSTFAQHFLLTYFPAAYPRWYIEGFGELFSTMDTATPGVIEYGQRPDKYRRVIEKFGHYPLKRVLDGTYLNDKRWFPAFSPYTAWGLAHLLFFSDEWKAPLHNYLAAVATGKSPEEAAAALGDLSKLAKQVAVYEYGKVPFERMTYPAGRFSPPLVRRLKKSEAAYVRGRLELGARVELAKGDGAKGRALGQREAWLKRLRSNAGQYPRELVAQQLLAEAECRSGNAANCVASADRALLIAAKDPVALTWKGYGLALEASGTSASGGDARLSQARAMIIEANHLDTQSVLPLLAYYRSYAVSGEKVPDDAIDGLAKSLDAVPSAPSTRLLLGEALARRSDRGDARRILLPLARGAFDPPEKPEAEQLLNDILSKPLAFNGH